MERLGSAPDAGYIVHSDDTHWINIAKIAKLPFPKCNGWWVDQIEMSGGKDKWVGLVGRSGG